MKQFNGVLVSSGEINANPLKLAVVCGLAAALISDF